MAHYNNPVWRAGPLDSGVVPYPGLRQTDAVPPQTSAVAMHHWPQPWQWYYPPPHLPPTPSPAPPPTPMADSFTASLRALQTQFATFQEGLGGVRSDVKDVLAQIQALRAAQSKTDKSILELESVVGVGARRHKSTTTPEGGDVPEETLLQSVASIQSAIEALLAQSRPSVPRLRISADPPVARPQERSVTDSPTFESMQFTFPVSSLSRSSAIHTPDLPSSLPSATPVREYADSSIQTSTSTSSSHGHTPRFITVDWNADQPTLRRFTTGYVRPTADCLAAPTRCDDPRTSTTLELRTPVSSSFSPQEPNSQGQRADSILSAMSSSSTSSAIDTTPTVESPARLQVQSSERTPSSTPEAVDSSMTPSQTGPPGVLPSPSPLGLLTSTPDSRASSSAANVSVQNPARVQAPSPGTNASMMPKQHSVSRTSISSLSSLTSIDTRGTPAAGSRDAGSDPRPPHVEPSAAAVKTQGPQPSLTRRRGPSPVEADDDDDGPPSGLPTPPSETVLDERPRPVNTHVAAAAAKRQRDLARRRPFQFTVIATPPLWTPEPSGDRAGEEMGLPLTPASPLGSLFEEEDENDSGALDDEGGADASRSQSDRAAGETSMVDLAGGESSLTPALFSPASTLGSLFEEEGEEIEDDEQSPARRETTEEKTDLDHAQKVAEGISPDKSSSQTDRVAAETSTSTLPARGSHSMAIPNEESSQASPAAGDASVGVDPSYSPTTAYFGYDIPLTSPVHRLSPPPSATSRYVTPSESSEVRQTQDEDEVWRALLLGPSGLSTPSSLQMMFSRAVSAASVPSSVSCEGPPLSVDPAVLQLRTPPPRPRGSPVHGAMTATALTLDGSLSSLSSLTSSAASSFRGDVQGAPGPVLLGSLSPLTSLEDTDEESVTLRRGRASRTDSAGSSLSGRCGVRCSEPYRAPGTLGASVSASASGRSASEAAWMQSMGGPGAQLEELMALARRPGARVRKAPEGKKGMKRKRDVDVDVDEDDAGVGRKGVNEKRAVEGVEEGRENGAVDDLFGDEMYLGEDAQAEQRDGNAPPPAQIEAETSVKGTRMATSPPVPRSVPEKRSTIGPVNADTTSKSSTSREASKKESERRRNKRKRFLKANGMSNVTYHVRNGQIVALAAEPEPEPEPELEPARPPEEPNPSGRKRHRKKRENQAMKTPPSSSGSATRPNQRRAHRAKSSPSKDDVKIVISKRAETWPDLPGAFSHWDAQFIQCDDCDRWYHYGCVAIITSADPRLEPEAAFACPKCHRKSVKCQKGPVQSDTCARPDCPAPQVSAESELYFVERLVGRKKVDGYVYMWLAKWEGYPMTQATWIPKENVVGGDTRLFDAFLEDAADEGVDLSRNLVLLREAVEAGWKA